ncbi:MAG: LysR family transcriptional regulator [Carnobacterium sp.]|uniref:LysR family transcriptional regulator n=2 Tax=Carnobacterium sp. TaxID=48221 RepID=UPI002FCAC1C6
MELRQLKYFITIANTRSYTAAAKSLFVTQPTLSWNIQQLEEEFNAHLFFQTKQGLQLTEKGEKLLTRGQKVLDEFEGLIEDMHKMQPGKKNLKVGITVLFVIQYMEQIVQFTTMNPEVELTFVQSGSVEIQEKLAQNEIDIGLVSFPNYESSIEIERLNTSHSQYTVSVVLPFDHPLAQKETIEIKDLKGYDICSFSNDYVLGNILHERCSESGFHPNIIFTNKNWEVLLQNTLTTKALTLMPQALERISNFKNLKWIPLKDKANFFEIGIAYKKNQNLEEHAIRFVNFMKKN